MPLFSKTRSVFRNLLSFRRVDADLDQEVRSHLDLLVQERLRAGMTREQAERAARLELGGVEQVKEQVRDQRLGNWLHSVLADCRFGLRQLRKSPGFAVAAILTLALGIGANTAMFSVIDAVLLNPIPFPQSNRLMAIYANWPQFAKAPVSYPNFIDLQRQNLSFERIADWRIDWFTLTGSGETERLPGLMVSADFLSVLRVQPVLGRAFRRDDDRLGAAPVAMLGEGLWNRRFGSDPGIIGRSVTLNGKDYTIVGIVPKSVRLLHIQDSYFDNVLVPVGQWDNRLLRDRRFSMGLHTVGRLKPGVTLAQARAELIRFQNDLAAAYPNDVAGISFTGDPLKDDQIGDVQPTLLMLWGAVGLVLLIACANVANLLLTRANGRRQEFAIRTAMGASRSRVLRQFLIENCLLAAIGCTIGILLAKWGTRTVLSILPAVLPAASHADINWRVLSFAVAVSLVAVILFGLVPGLRSSKAALQEKLQESKRIAGSRHGIQTAFVAIEIGLALVLLSGAGLLIRSLQNAWAADPGFDPSGTLTCKVGFLPERMSNSAQAIEVIRELTARVSSIPGATSVAVALGGLPFEVDSEVPVWPHEKPKPEQLSAWPLALTYIVGPGYFQTMRIPQIRGRDFTARDNSLAPPVTIIDANLAKSMFPGQDPVGKRILIGVATEPSEIIGVVGHVARWGFDKQDKGPTVAFQIYSPSFQLSGPALPLVSSATALIVRTNGSPASLVDSIRQTVRSLDGSSVVYDTRTMQQIIAGSLAERRFSITLLGAFAGIALLLAAIGIYGVVSYLVGQRTHEIGIRMALGATPRGILRDVLGQGGKMALAGVALGLLTSVGFMRLMASMLFGVGVADPFTYAAVIFVLLGVAALACWLPARRAMRVDPMVALRYE